MRYCLLVVFVLSGCFQLFPTDGGSQAHFKGPRTFNTADMALPPLYRIELVASGLTFPTGVTFHNDGMAYVAESGYSYGEVWDTPRPLRVDQQGRTTVVAEGENNGPWTGVSYLGQPLLILGGIRIDL